jgi:hypothetical protein
MAGLLLRRVDKMEKLESQQTNTDRTNAVMFNLRLHTNCQTVPCDFWSDPGNGKLKTFVFIFSKYLRRITFYSY